MDFHYILVSILVFATWLSGSVNLVLMLWGMFACQCQELGRQWGYRPEAQCLVVTYLFSLRASGWQKLGVRACGQGSFSGTIESQGTALIW